MYDLVLLTMLQELVFRVLNTEYCITETSFCDGISLKK